MTLTLEQLNAIMPTAHSRAATFLTPLNVAILEVELNSKQRLAYFLAQVAHESGQLLYTRELASGEAYEGRRDLGNVQPGDGIRFRGRGLIQVTGRANYTLMSHDLGLDCVNHPELLESPLNATRSAGWFWKKKDLNQWSDRGDFITQTKRINGGTNGLLDRQGFLDKALQVL